ncbi:hypothetical protein LGT39_02800 [Demequina sp. TTPB684]|uniref:hypothetical protein n=1 Tax=unclassified Demequina TaxID=2620311 RepID=UPI001CF29AE9|nr:MULTISPECIES: hypothetical protein [unclassified Demequina]MCB2411777.1 hypothetical protein [Demequina sp. TTPB684]UPU89006.1 hypothetical protein LGT36_003530 [Demequina sp. TMPB413]
MIEITQRGGTYYVERRGRTWAKVCSGILLVPWLLLTLLPLLAGYGFAPLDVVWTLVWFTPAALLSFGPGRTKRHEIIAMLDARDVAGGVLMTVMDARQVTHQLVVNGDASAAMASALSGSPNSD